MSLDLELALLAARCHREAAETIPPRRPMTDHGKVIGQLKSTPGTWVLAVAYRSTRTADAMRGFIEHGKHHYTPAGAFEARTLTVGLGTGLFVRYTGGGER